MPVRVLKVRRCARTAGGGGVIVVGVRAIGGRSLAVPKGRDPNVPSMPALYVVRIRSFPSLSAIM
jgi:hypothetical protein